MPPGIRTRSTLHLLLPTAWFIATALVAQEPPATAGSQRTASGTFASGRVIARVGDEAILAEDLQREMARRGGKIPGRFATPEQRRALLDEMIRNRAVLQAAREQGFDRDPEFVAAVEKILTTRYLKENLEKGEETIDIADKEVAEFYRAHASEFEVPARSRGAWIFLDVPEKATPEKIEEARRRAESLRVEALALPAGTKNFGDLARNHSDDTGTRYIGGEFGWVTASDAQNFRYGAEVVSATIALEKPGELSPVVRTARGFAVVKLVTREAAAPAPLEKMAPGIRSRMVKERRAAAREAFYAALLRDLPVTVDSGALATVAPLSPPAPSGPVAPPPLPGGD